MKETVVAAVTTLVMVPLMASAPPSLASPRPADRVVYLERTFAENVDLGEPGPSTGDFRATRGLVRNAVDGRVIGSYATSQMTLAVGLLGGSEERSVIMEITIGKNDVTMVSTYVVPTGAPPAKRVVHPIVGGTGKYAGAQGTLTLVPLDATQYRAVMRFV